MITIASDSPCGQTRERSCVLTTHPAKLVKTVEETLPPGPSSGLPGSHTIPCWPLQGKLTATVFPFQTHTFLPSSLPAYCDLPPALLRTNCAEIENAVARGGLLHYGLSRRKRHINLFYFLFQVVDLMELRSIADRELSRLEKDCRFTRTIFPRWCLLKANSLFLSGRQTAATAMFNQVRSFFLST